MKRFLLFVSTVAIITAFAMPQADVSAAQRQTKGKPPKEEKVVRALLSLADRAGDTLRSDGRVRLADDADDDGFGDLTLPGLVFSGPIIYQDRLDPVASTGFHPDPCTVFDDVDSRGLARARLNANNCSVLGTPEDPDIYADDARTFTLVFDRNTAGGRCACDKFKYLDETTMYNGEPANSTFAYKDDGTAEGICEVTPAAGPIVTDSTHNMTGSQQILAYPFEDLQSTKRGKGRSGNSIPEFTTVTINFRTDRQVAGQANGWQLFSQGENIPIELVDGDPDTFVVSAEKLPFELWLGGSLQCPDVIEMTFQMRFTRFEVTK